ncbi:MAG: amino acid ABC transporter permease [Anaerolineae bacterium]|nr:amino acid ABC transporter permease [Anaerolineae bacterium]
MNTSAALPPLTERISILRWLRQNLFRSVADGAVTVLGIVLLLSLVIPIVTWALTEARWQVVIENIRLFAIGQYPIEYVWRVWVCVLLLALICGVSWGLWLFRQRAVGAAILTAFLLLGLLPGALSIPATEKVAGFGLMLPSLAWLVAMSTLGALGYAIAARAPARARKLVGPAWILYLPVCFVLVAGLGPDGLLATVGSNLWGGLLLTLLITAVGIVASFPLGVLLALGRRSKLPVVKAFCIGYIELIRGVPLITILFMAQLILPLFLPDRVTFGPISFRPEIDRVIRAMAGVSLFSAAYMAENVRGGLQNIPRGQFEAADALGLTATQKMTLIVLPQALRMVVPILVGQFIGLFKDTSLVTIVSLLDLLGIGNTVLAQPKFIGTQREVYLFVAAIYWIFSYVMGAISRRLELPQSASRR